MAQHFNCDIPFGVSLALRLSSRMANRDTLPGLHSHLRFQCGIERQDLTSLFALS